MSHVKFAPIKIFSYYMRRWFTELRYIRAHAKSEIIDNRARSALIYYLWPNLKRDWVRETSQEWLVSLKVSLLTMFFYISSKN